MTRVTQVLRKLILRVSALTLVLAFVPVHADDVADKGKQQAMINLLVRAGKSEEAAVAMRALYPNGPPLGGELALEYYGVVGNTDKGWEEARIALEKLVKAAPQDLSYRLVLARHLARRAATRRGGLQMFAELSGQPAIKQQVLEEWRRALGRLDSSPASIKLYQDYLKVDPDNTSMLDALASAQRAEAKRLPWQMRDKADAQLAAGHPEEAAATLKKALQLDPLNAWVRFDLARLYHKQGDEKQGRSLMEKGMSIAPGDAGILYANALYASLLGETENALRLLEKVPVSRRSPAMQRLKRELRILVRTRQEKTYVQEATKPAEAEPQPGEMRDKADAQLAAGHPEEAVGTLKNALQLDPKNAWVRFDLSRLYYKQGDEKLGRALMEEGLSVAPGDDDMLYADALYISLLEETENALSLLEKIPASRRSPAMQRLKQKLTIQKQARQAQALARTGKGAEMQAVMQYAEADAGNDAELVNIVANAWFDLNDPARGVALMQHLAAQPSPPKDTSLYYAKLLNRAERDEELAAVLEKLAAAGELAGSDREDLRYLNVSLAVREADTLRHTKNFAAAKAALAPVLKQYPENTDLLMAQARVHVAAHEPQQARAIYQWILDRPQREMEVRLARAGNVVLKFDLGAFAPVNVGVRLALAKAMGEAGDEAAAQREMDIVLANMPADDFDNRMAIADWYAGMGNTAAARAVVEQSRRIAPDSPSVLIQAGRIALAEKHYDEAMADFKRANAADEIAGMERRRARGYVTTGTDFLNKPGGAPGISNLTTQEVPVEMHMPDGYGGGQTFIQVDPVSVNAGLLQLSDDYNFLRYGKVLAADSNMNTRASAPLQTARGVALAVGYEGDGMRADIGITPLGFPVTDVVGGVKWSHYTETSGFSFGVSRRPLTSSLVSYAGVHDPVTNEVWGGVRSNGASMHVSRDRGRLSGFVDLGCYWLTGKNVLNNTEFALRTGFDWSFIREEDTRLTVGLAFTEWHYRENLRYYTFGHGGYYSPQKYYSLALPFRWTGSKERWSYLLQGSVSASVSYEKDMPFYPTDAVLQQTAANAAVTKPIYTGGNGHGTGWSLGGELEYKFTPQLFGGARLSMDRSDYYTPNSAIFYLRYMFDAYAGTVPYPPDPVKAYSRY